MYKLNDNVTYFDNFGVEHIPKKIKKLVDKSIVLTNIFRIQAYDTVMLDITVLDLLILCLKVRT